MHRHNIKGYTCNYSIIEPGVCDEGDARLVNGDIEQEGRLEVCTNGVWGTVCNTLFSTTDGYVACKQLQRDSSTGQYNMH